MSGRTRPDPSTWRRLAVLAPNWIGDAVMSEPAIRAVHEACPALEIVAIGRAAPLVAYAGHPAIGETLALDDRGLLGPWTVGRRVAATGADAILLLRGSFRSALVARASGIGVRIGVDRDGRRPLLTHPVPRPDRDDRPRPTLALYAALVDTLGVEVAADATPRIHPPAAERQRAESLLASLPRPILGMVPGGSKVPKRWPPDRFAEVARRCRDRIGGVALFGGPEERAILAAVARAVGDDGPPVIDLSSSGMALSTLPAAIGVCDALLTNDTGPRHLAIAQDLPVISLFGPTDHRWTIVPGAREDMLLAEPFLDDEHIADRHPAACRIERIPVDDVVHAVHALPGFAAPDRGVSSDA